ncbi:MAG: septum formation initiator family protein [Defluviitaleaceae bacterium]|nr:septum formation initiator family protein [Defluviitaleaceae bacterium]
MNERAKPCLRRTSRSLLWRIKNFLLFLAFITIIVAFAIIIRRQYDSFIIVERQIAEVREQIDEQNLITQQLRYEQSLFGTAEWYEQVARRRLGLVRRNDVIFGTR